MVYLDKSEFNKWMMQKHQDSERKIEQQDNMVIQHLSTSNTVTLMYIDLQAVVSNTVDLAIHWAQTNKDFSRMKDKYIYCIDVFSGNRARSDCTVGRLIRKNMPEFILQRAAPSLTKVQQWKLSYVLHKINRQLPKQASGSFFKQSTTDNTDNK